MEEKKKEKIKEASIKEENKSKSIYIIISLFIIIIFVAFIIALKNTGLINLGSISNKKAELNYTTTNNKIKEGIYITDVSEVVEEVMPSIVSITSKTLVKQGLFGPSYYN